LQIDTSLPPISQSLETSTGVTTCLIGGGDHVDFQVLRDIDTLFAHRWDVFVIACLGEEGPLRFNQLAHAVSEQTGTRMIDSTLARIKDRLIRAGLVMTTDEGDGHPTYSLTNAGRARADTIRTITDALAPPDDPAGGGTDDDGRPPSQAA
jgi:DNA-binding HxlR family transcriptional regulator